jgi:hypothetical protein
MAGSACQHAPYGAAQSVGGDRGSGGEGQAASGHQGASAHPEVGQRRGAEGGARAAPTLP